jgi:cellulose synthase (UDP-forming)
MDPTAKKDDKAFGSKTLKLHDMKNGTGQYNDDPSNSIITRNVYDPSFRSLPPSTFSGCESLNLSSETPNIRKYHVGSGFFHLTILSGIVGIIWLTFCRFILEEHACQSQTPKRCRCNQLHRSHCGSIHFARPRLWWIHPRGDKLLYSCYATRSLGHVRHVCSFRVSQFFLGLLLNFGMWPIRRGARFMFDFKAIPAERWPKVDVFLCHYMEPVVDSLKL